MLIYSDVSCDVSTYLHCCSCCCTEKGFTPITLPTSQVFCSRYSRTQFIPGCAWVEHSLWYCPLVLTDSFTHTHHKCANIRTHLKAFRLVWGTCVLCFSTENPEDTTPPTRWLLLYCCWGVKPPLQLNSNAPIHTYRNTQTHTHVWMRSTTIH